MNSFEKINVCLACDDNYARYSAVVVASILKNARQNDNLCIYILDGGIEELNRQKILSLKYIKDCEINFVKIDNEMFSEYLSIKTHSYISIPTFYRLKLPTLLPNVDRIIYFDCDVVVNTSLRELFDVDMENCVVAGVHDLKKSAVKENPTYVNAGMLVFDVKKMAEIGVEKQFADWTREHFETIKLGDQEIINEVLKGKIKVVDDEWNVQSSNFVNRSSYTNSPKIIHFVSSKKPWHFGSFSIHKDYYFKYLQLTPWALQTEEDEKYWIKWNKICSFFGYFKYRPLFFLRPRFYQAVFETCMKPLFQPCCGKIKTFLKQIFSVNIFDGHLVVFLFGFQIRSKIKSKSIENIVTENGLNTEPRDVRVVASLTTFPERISTVKETIKTLLLQTCKPDELVLWLANEQFSSGEESLPKDLLALKEFGLSIKWCKDLRSYKKLVPSLKEYPNDIIITFDDDIYYDKNVIEMLYNSYLKHPNCISTNRASRLDFQNGKIKKLKTSELYWTRFDDETFKNVQTGCGGVLYPPHCLSDEVTDESKFMSIMPTQDDVWFWAMAVLNKTKIRVVSSYDMNIQTVENTQQYGLSKINNKKSGKGLHTKDGVQLISEIYPQIVENMKN